jgi:hypothetical protein
MPVRAKIAKTLLGFSVSSRGRKAKQRSPFLSAIRARNSGLRHVKQWTYFLTPCIRDWKVILFHVMAVHIAQKCKVVAH